MRPGRNLIGSFSFFSSLHTQKGFWGFGVYKNIDSKEGQYLSPFQARAKWVLFKQRWIPDDGKEPDHDTVKKMFPVKDYNRMEKLCKDMDNARSMRRISNPRVN
jgi:hypothetical protein